MFYLVSFETFGAFGSKAKPQITETGRRLTESSDEPRSLPYLKRSVLVEIERENAASVLGTNRSVRGLKVCLTNASRTYSEFSAR